MKKREVVTFNVKMLVEYALPDDYRDFIIQQVIKDLVITSIPIDRLIYTADLVSIEEQNENTIS